MVRACASVESDHCRILLADCPNACSRCVPAKPPARSRESTTARCEAMSPLATIALLLFTGAITPGPNNLIVLRKAAEHGWQGSLGDIAAIVAGSVILLSLALAGVAALVAGWPVSRAILAGIGAAYLGWLGACLLRGTPASGNPGPGLDGVPAVFLFQFLNPKGWLLMLVVAAAAPAGAPAAAWPLLPLTAAITGACLLLWAALGHALARAFADPARRRGFDRACGVVLLGCAFSLLA